ncbi:class Ib ribonucleoside-diphosphate reductase assembly flavoprotein NrdI [Bifidobacterium pseudocatenulatum]|uniref:class Ib ribonucleoside-diphosphate reductase assembly flavoprotein NrdI n=1 Tax=Bifidobacterium pseudocatenulatum TaxID=28026 RepID=UPI003D790060
MAADASHHRRRRILVRVSSRQNPRAGGSLPVSALVHFSSASGNTTRFVEGCRLDEFGIHTMRIPLRPDEPELHVDEPYVLLTPTYGGGTIGKAVPVQVKRFLNDERNRSGIIGVIASGNTNFGEAYGIAGDIIAAKCRVPLLYRFELMGTSEDTATVREGLRRFFDEYTQQEQR